MYDIVFGIKSQNCELVPCVDQRLIWTYIHIYRVIKRIKQFVWPFLSKARRELKIRDVTV
jgi:hypothetical protein